jgi:CheY-like chemotaxis protein
VTVSDTGTGIAEADLERVFEPFFTTKPVGQGTGLGLSMVYGFARQSGGQAKIRSQPGKGTAVTIYLPATDMGADPEQAQRPAGANGAGRSVLLVEDDATVRMLVRDLLDDLGFATVEADSGEAALTLLAGDGDELDLLISDVGLPGMNGRQLADEVRARVPDLPVLFMTGYAEIAASPADFLGPGMQLIAKPFKIDALAAAIGKAFPSRTAERAESGAA